MVLENRLKALREASGLSQSKIAALAGVSRNAVSQWEAGVTQPSSKRLAMLAKAYGVTLDELSAASPVSRDAVIHAAIRLFDRLGVENATIDDICIASECTPAAFGALFPTKEALVAEAARMLAREKIARLAMAPPSFGSVAARLKYLLQMMLAHDLAHLSVLSAANALSWRWDSQTEREFNLIHLEHQELIVSILEASASINQIRRGNFSAAAQLILAAYTTALRKAVHGDRKPEAMVMALTPQITLVLDAFGFVDVPGFSDER